MSFFIFIDIYQWHRCLFTWRFQNSSVVVSRDWY